MKNHRTFEQMRQWRIGRYSKAHDDDRRESYGRVPIDEKSDLL
jgi:hypothetical protein